MPKCNEVNLADYFKMPNPGLKTYIGRTNSGQSDVYYGTFNHVTSEKDVHEVAQAWMNILSGMDSKYESLLKYETEQMGKIGPMSYQLPLADRLKDVESYYEDILLPSEPIDQSAISAVITEFSKVRGTNVRSVARTWDKMDKSKNSGSPFFTKKKFAFPKSFPWHVAEVPNSYNNRYRGYVQDLKDILRRSETYSAAALLGWRGQSGGPSVDDVKQRVIWMFPLVYSVEELRVYQPLIEQMQKHELVAPWLGTDAVDARMTQLFDTKSKDDLVVCTDFSKFDQHFNADMAEAAELIVGSLLARNKTTRDWMRRIFPVKYHIPLICNEETMYVGRHGMASGSGGTNFDETMTHRALQYEAAIRNNSRLNLNSMCLGDDGVITYPGITVEQVMQAYSSHGQDMNEDKQYVSTHEAIFLRRWYDSNYRVEGICVGVYPTMRALNSLMHQEKYYNPEIWSKEMVALRQLSIIENCKYHPMRDQFAEFCMERDKFRLGLDIPGFLDNIGALAKKSIEFMPDFLGYLRGLNRDSETRGIESWWIVNYLKSK